MVSLSLKREEAADAANESIPMLPLDNQNDKDTCNELVADRTQTMLLVLGYTSPVDTDALVQSEYPTAK